MTTPSPTTCRLLIVLAAVLWSTSSLFIRTLQQPTWLGLDEPRLSPLQLAFYRALFGGLCLLPLVRRADIRFRPTMGLMVFMFAVMTGLYLSAIGLGSAANAILLQNTAPVWVYLIGVYLLGQPGDRRTLRTLLVAMLGAGVIVAGNWPQGLERAEAEAQIHILLMAAGSGVFFAAVVLLLDHLTGESAAWLTVLNMVGSASVIAAFVLLTRPDATDFFLAPTARQLAFLAVFGLVQMAGPYWLFARGMRGVGPQEAGIITLLEPLLNPVWAYLIAPDRETPTPATLAGGAILLAALVWRYWPRRDGAGQGDGPAVVEPLSPVHQLERGGAGEVRRPVGE